MSTQSVTEFYETDHDRLDELLQQYRQLKRIDFARAKPFFREFKFGLQRHIIWEEEILFPLFERATGITNGPTEVMRREHRMIGAVLEAIHDRVRLADPESDADETLLMNTLAAHNEKEEKILYPAIDRVAGEEGRTSIYRQMDSVPPERYAQCCHHQPSGKTA